MNPNNGVNDYTTTWRHITSQSKATFFYKTQQLKTNFAPKPISLHVSLLNALLRGTAAPTKLTDIQLDMSECIMRLQCSSNHKNSNNKQPPTATTIRRRMWVHWELKWMRFSYSVHRSTLTALTLEQIKTGTGDSFKFAVARPNLIHLMYISGLMSLQLFFFSNICTFLTT